MRQSSTETAWSIVCHSPAEAATLQQTLAARIDLDRIMTDSVRVVEGGTEQEHIEPHRLGDYFAAITILPDTQASPAAFHIVFRRQPTAGRFWKDLMVNLLQEIETSPQKPTIKRDAEWHIRMEGVGS
jgi:hypothetical protein